MKYAALPNFSFLDLRRSVSFLLIVYLAGTIGAQTTYYVNAATGNDANSGLSWATAFSSFQRAIDAAVSGDEIYLSEGIYYPSLDENGNLPADPRDATFYLDKALNIQGGFPDSGNPVSGDEDVDLYQTILSGDLGVIGDPSDNAYTVLHTLNFNTGDLRECWIKDGNADGLSGERSAGGGWYAEYNTVNGARTTVESCRFVDNQARTGGGIHIKAAGGDPRMGIFSTIFQNNFATLSGGACYLAGDGGGLDVSIYNSLFWGNIASDRGGAIGYDDPDSGRATFSYCTFVENTAANGGGTVGIRFWDSGMVEPWFLNCISWDNGTTFAQTSSGTGSILLDDCLIEDSSCPTGAFCFQNSVIFDQDPLFVDAFNGDFHLQACSPAIDEGTFSSSGGSFDFDGDPRPFNNDWDMGYDEYTGASCCPAGNIIYVNATATGANSGTSWADAFTDLQTAIDFARTGLCPNVDRIWVAEGTYYPSKDVNGNASPVDPRDKTFFIDFQLSIFGSFPNTGNPGEFDRNVYAHPTILSGELGAVNPGTGNAYTVVYTQNIGQLTSYSDLIISDGNADGSNATARGKGGGWLNEATTGSVSNPAFSLTFFQDNNAGIGGGFYNDGRNAVASPRFTNCRFRNNFSAGNGGGVYSIGDNGTTSPYFFNTLFWGNIASSVGGAFGYDDGQQGIPEFQHCTFYENLAAGGGGAVGIVFWDSGQQPPVLQNSIAWANGSTFAQTGGGAGSLEVNYSLIQETSCPTGAICSGVNIFSQPPQFLDADTGDFRLDGCSPAINAGVDVTTNTFDFEGQARPLSGGYDLGMDEVFEPTCCPSGAAVFVDINANGNNNGTNWTDAFTDLQDAFDFVMAGSCIGVSEVWVATGTYKPTTDLSDDANPSDPRQKVFHYEGPMQVYGGFDGSETTLSQRDPATHITILSGDLGGAGSADDAYTVVQLLEGGTDYVLDGFTITRGNADGNAIDASGTGGGIFIGAVGGNVFSTPTIRNCEITLNSAQFGGGVCIQGDGNFQVRPLFEDCRISFNTATFSGGGVFNNMGSGTGGPTFEKCELVLNSASGFGGAVHSPGGSGSGDMTFRNSLVAENTAGLGGGGIAFGDPVQGGMLIQHCTFADNSSGNGGVLEILNWDGSQFAINVQGSLFWGNATTFNPNGAGTQANFNNCLIDENSCPNGAVCNGMVFNQNPIFVDPFNDNYHLGQCSPAIDAIASSPITEDFEGDSRPQGAAYDIGYDEYTGAACCPTGSVIYVNIAATGNDTGLDWANAFTDLQSAVDLVKAGTCGSLNEIWVAQGTYLPSKDAMGNLNPVDPRDKTFFFDFDVALYGGFDGTETQRSQRDFNNNITMLSGDIGNGFDPTDNAYTVVHLKNVSQSFTLNGFWVQDGQANGSGLDARSIGGGMYNDGSGSGNASNPDLESCVFTANHAQNGGGLYNRGLSGQASPSLVRCTFFSNTAAADGAAMFNDRARPFIIDGSFGSNTATGDGGAILSNGNAQNSSMTLINTSFIGNTAGGRGGALHNNANGPNGICSPAITNCLFGANQAAYGGAIYYTSFQGVASGVVQNATFVDNQGTTDGDAVMIEANAGTSAPIFRNNIFWANGANNRSIGNNGGSPSISYSLLPDTACPFSVTCGGGMIYNDDPEFMDQLGGDFNLQMSSPAIDAGTFGNSTTVDLEGNPRVQGNAIDLGPLESPFTALPVEWRWFRTTDGQSPRTVKLEWATASEVNNSHFEVQRSGTGRTFETIGRVTAQSSGSDSNRDTNTYEFVDRQPLGGYNYYRLRQVDLDGITDFSEVREWFMEGTSAGLLLYPNPAGEYVLVAGALEYISVLDLTGRLLIRVPPDAEGPTRIGLSELTAGVYWVRVGGLTNRLIVE